MSRRDVVEWGSRERATTVAKREDTIFVARHAMESKCAVRPKANLEPVVESRPPEQTSVSARERGGHRSLHLAAADHRISRESS